MNRVQHPPFVAANGPNDAPVLHITIVPRPAYLVSPYYPEPDFVTLAQFLIKTINGSFVEPDDICQSGHSSWPLSLGII